MSGGIELNRTALTIRMLMILKARAIQEPISTEKLAALLETNPRNIREYRKELETAGFTIEHKKGPYGGYLLEKSALFPVPKLTRYETLALKKVFNGSVPPVSSTKGQIGHCLGAAGGLEAVISIMAMQKGILPPTINQTQKDPDCDLDYIPNIAREAKIDTIMSNSFGFGGTNGVVIFKRV